MQHEDFERLRANIYEFCVLFAEAMHPFTEAVHTFAQTPIFQAWYKAQLEREHREEVLRTQLAIYTHCRKKSVQHKIEAIENELAMLHVPSVFKHSVYK